MIREENTTPVQMADSIIWAIRDTLTIRPSGMVFDKNLLEECVIPLADYFVDLYMMNTLPDEDFKNYEFWLEVKQIIPKRLYYKDLVDSE